jgi:hypothetical protein
VDLETFDNSSAAIRPLLMAFRLLSVLLAVSFGAATLAAQDPALFTVSGVEVDVTDRDAAQAKLKAISEAQVKAFKILVERLGEPGDADKVSHLKPSQIGRLMASLSVEQEQSGPQRYVGTLTIKFLPKRVQKALSQIKFSYVSEQSPKILVIPVWRSENGLVLWEENPWRTAWQNLKAENSLVPVLIPLGDLTDSNTLSPEDIVNGPSEELEALGYRYEAEAVLLAFAEPIGDNSVHAAMSGESPVGKISFDKKYVSTEGGVLAAAEQAAERFHTVMTFKWKKAQRNQGLSDSNVQVVNIAVPFSSLAEWNALRGQMAVTPGVTAMDVNSLSSSGANVRLTYNIPFEQLRTAMHQQRLNLVLVSGMWVVQPF